LKKKGISQFNEKLSYTYAILKYVTRKMKLHLRKVTLKKLGYMYSPGKALRNGKRPSI
jgi:hypothetical protein